MDSFVKFGLKEAEEYKLEMSPGSIKRGLKAIGKASDMFMASPRKIRVIDGLNVRIKDDLYWQGIRELAEGMAEHGFFRDRPLAVYVASERVVQDGTEVFIDTVCLTEGHRRLDAALYWMEHLGAPEDLVIPIVHKPSGTSMLDLNYALLEANKHVDFRPYEKAILIKRMHVSFGQPVPEIAKKTGLAESTVHNLLLVAGAPEEIAKLVLIGDLSITEAADVMRSHKDKAFEVLAQAKAISIASGKTKISKRFLPGEKFKGALKKNSESIYDAVQLVRQDKGYEALSDETRETVDALVKELAEVKAKLEEQEAKALAKAAEESQDALDTPEPAE